MRAATITFIRMPHTTSLRFESEEKKVELTQLEHTKQMETEVEIDVGQENFSTSKVGRFLFGLNWQR